MNLPWWYTSLLSCHSYNEVIDWNFSYNTEVARALWSMEKYIGRDPVIRWISTNWSWLKNHLTVIPDRLDGNLFLSGPNWWCTQYYFNLDPLDQADHHLMGIIQGNLP